MAEYNITRQIQDLASYNATFSESFSSTVGGTTLTNSVSQNWTNLFNWGFSTMRGETRQGITIDIGVSTLIDNVTVTEKHTLNHTLTNDQNGTINILDNGDGQSSFSSQTEISNTTLFTSNIVYTTRKSYSTSSGSTTSTFNGSILVPTITTYGTGDFTTTTSTRNTVLTNISSFNTNSGIDSFYTTVKYSYIDYLTRDVDGFCEMGTIVDYRNERLIGWKFDNSPGSNPVFVSDAARSFNISTFWPEYDASALFIVTKGSPTQTKITKSIEDATSQVNSIFYTPNTSVTSSYTIVSGEFFPKNTTTISYNPIISETNNITIGEYGNTYEGWGFNNGIIANSKQATYKYTSLIETNRFLDKTTVSLRGIASRWDTKQREVAAYEPSPGGVDPQFTAANSDSTYASIFQIVGTTTYNTRVPSIFPVENGLKLINIFEAAPNLVFVEPQQLTISNKQFTYGTNLSFDGGTIFYPLTGKILDNVYVPILSNYSTTDTKSQTWKYSYSDHTGKISFTCYSAAKKIASSGQGRFRLMGNINSQFYSQGGTVYGGFNSYIPVLDETVYFNTQAIKGTSFNTNGQSSTFNGLRAPTNQISQSVWSKDINIELTTPAVTLVGNNGVLQYTSFSRNYTTNL